MCFFKAKTKMKTKVFDISAKHIPGADVCLPAFVRSSLPAFQLFSALMAIPNLTVLGPPISLARRLPIASVVIRTPWDPQRCVFCV